MGLKPVGKHFTSIKTRIALTTLVTVSIVLFSVSAALFFYFHNVLRESIFNQQFSMVSELAEQLNGRIQLARYQLSLAATEIDRETLADPARLQQILDQLSPINMIFDSGFVVIGTDGRVIAENMGFTDLLGLDLNHRDYVREPLATGKPYVSGPFRFILRPHNPLIAIVTPIRDNNDKIICLLAGYHSLGTDQFLTSMSPKGLGNGGYLGILSGRTILMHNDNARIMDVIPPGANPGIDLALKGIEGSLVNVSSKGKRLLSSFKIVGETGWIMGANLPYDEAFKPLNRLVYYSIAILAAGIIFSLLVLWYVTRQLTLPIRQLIGHVDAAGTGTQEWRAIEMRTGDEIERLADAFNNLMQEVQDTKQLLADERDFFSGIIQNSAAPMFVIDNNHKTIFWNNALTALTGYSALEMIGTDLQWSPFYPAKRPVLADLVIDRALDHADEYYATHSTSLFTEGSIRGEGWYDNIGGKRRYIFFEAAPVKNGNNEIIAAVETLEDITERVTVETELASSRLELETNHAKLEHLFAEVAHGKREWEETIDSLRDFIILTDPEHRIRRCNRLLADATGKSLVELIGLDWRDLLTAAGFDFVNLNESCGEIFHKDSGRSYDMTIYKTGKGETFGGYVISINNTTELRNASQELQKAYAELKEAQLQIFQQEKMASIGQLAAGVAHEINNPLGFISSNLGTLDKYLSRLTEYITAVDKAVDKCCLEEAGKLEKMRTSLKIDFISGDAGQLIAESQDGAERVRRIVQDLRSFSRVDQAEQALVNLNEALEATINIAWHEIRYVADLKREFGDIPEILCYPQQLNQVFLNLLINAAHAMEGRQGSITVRTWREDSQVCFSVSDTGCGIPDNILPRIFEPFFTTKEIGKGTGLGLSISYDIIKRHGGVFKVISEVDKGTTCIVSLPVIA